MGRQINFYMTHKDELDFIEFAKSDRDICIFADRATTPDPKCLGELPREDIPGWFVVWLWDQSNSPRPIWKFIEEQEHYVVDPFESEIIEFWRSTFYRGHLVRGRIWAEMSFVDPKDPSKVVSKKESFRRWFNRLANWIRRNSVRDAAGDYLLPGAAEFVKKGGKTVQAILGNGSFLPG